MSNPMSSSNDGHSADSSRRRPRRYAESAHSDPKDSMSPESNQPATADASDTDVKTTLDKVLTLIHAHKSYTTPAQSETLTEQAKFDDISRYGITEEQEDQLWEVEATRLLEAVAEFDEPLLFESPIENWVADRQGFEQLSNLADQALCGLNICIHDNQLLLFEHLKSLFDPQAYLKARTLLTTRFDEQKAFTADPLQKTAKTPAKLPAMNAEAYCALIDYVTAVVARFTLKGIPTEFWHTRALSGLSKCSAKLKVLVMDMEKSAVQSLEDGQDTLAKDEVFHAMGVQGGPMLDIVNPDGGRFKDGGTREAVSQLSDVQKLLREAPDSINVYFAEMALMSSWTLDSLRSIFYTLRSSQISGYSLDAFDICSLIYKAGLNGLPTLVHQDRDGEISGTGFRDFIRMSQTPFKMVRQVAIEVSKRARPPPRAGNPLPGSMVSEKVCGASFSLEYEEGDDPARTESGPDTTHVNLDQLGDIVSVMVPLLCTQTVTMMELVWAFEIVTGISAVSNTINFSGLPVKNMTAFASLRTNAYEKEVKLDPDSDARPLSRSLLAQSRLYTWNRKVSNSTKTWDALPKRERARAIREAEQNMARLENIVRNWEVGENVVIVKRQGFVTSVIVVAAILVIGGIIIGILLGERLTGVDPFNITVFVWVFAGFVLLVSKSLLVAEWPWRDFLRGRVPCRSVSELHTVTGVDEQEIIEYLLSKEAYTILVTKGPFNRPFARRASDGFSIDVKIELRTLVASGIIVVKIASRQGPALICLDLRRGTPGRAGLQHSDAVKKDEKVLGCFEFPEAFDEAEEVPLQEVTTNWTRILGIYHRPYKRFR